MRTENLRRFGKRLVLGSRARRSTAEQNKRPLALTCEARIDLTAQENDGETKRPTFEILAYTGGAMHIAWQPDPVVIDLAGLEARQDVSVLLDHWRDAIVGQSNEVKIGRNALTLAGIITGAIDVVGEPAWKVVTQARNGFKWKASVGVEAINVEFVEAGSSAQANGKTFAGPVYIVRKGRLGEVSFVAIDADGKSAATIAARQRNAEIQAMDFEEWLKANGFDPAKITDEQRPTLEAAWKAGTASDEPDPAGGDDDGDGNGDQSVKPKVTANVDAKPLRGGGNVTGVEQEVAKIRKALAIETRRVGAIQTICGTAHPEICAQAIEEGWLPEKVELEVYKAAMPQIGVSGGNGNGDGHSTQALEAALCMSVGLPEERVGKWYGERPMNAALARDLRGAGLHTLIFAAIQAAGGHVRPGMVNNETIQAAFEANNRVVQATGGFSTISLAGILSNVAEKSLLDAYNAVGAVAGRFCAEVDHGNFKTHTKYRMTGVGRFEAVAPNGELKHITLTEESYTNTVSTQGAIIMLTRQMMIDDDLGAFIRIVRILGRMAAIAKEKAAFTLLLADTGTFFSSAHKNLKTGAGSALGIDALTAAEQAMADQTDANGDPILISPRILLTGTARKVYAQQLFKDLNVNETTTTDKPKPKSNPHAGKFDPVSSPFVNAQGLTGSSATVWYLFADPADVAAMEIAYLRGKRQPTIEGGQPDFDKLGMGWRSFFDFGVAFQDWRAAEKNDGV